ncbi:MAG TPA: hypothetical protein VH395_11885 [Jatrophihabitantaceae bacterium]|jgi:hypothetical protein
MSRFTELSKAARKPALASATAGVCVALAVTGVELAGGHPAAARASATATPSAVSSSSIAAAPAGYTTAAYSRALAKRHNPHGTSHVRRGAGRATIFGRAWDRDSHKVWVVLYRNGHRVDADKTAKRTHRYRVHANLHYGVNDFKLVVHNVGKGTSSTTLRYAHMRMRKTWTAHYHGAKRIAAQMFHYFGWGRGQMQPLINLWNRESGWSTHAANPSGAYGIPQALPGSKMSSAGPNWHSNARTQIRWGLGYIKSRYGSPNNAWAHSQATNWY